MLLVQNQLAAYAKEQQLLGFDVHPLTPNQFECRLMNLHDLFQVLLNELRLLLGAEQIQSFRA